MAIIKKSLGMNVLEASITRIKNIFASGCKVYLNVSGGKDSIVMMSLVYDLCVTGECDPKQLEVFFIDEEVIYDDVIRICKDWRKKFMLIGAKYHWWCIEHRNNNCFNALENNESFIPWDRYEQDKWHHEKPSFAEDKSPYLTPRTDNYQDFLTKSERDGITMIGVRAAESLNRIQYLAQTSKTGGITNAGVMYPIYDWKDEDVWKYIKDKDLDFPLVYLRLWEAGAPKKRLRVCNLFSIDTCAQLNYMFEIYPELWEAVLKREPNAYLVRLYWDTEMFHRETHTKKKLDALVDDSEKEKVDYKKKFVDVINNPKKYFRNAHALNMAKQYRRFYLRNGDIMQEPDFKKAYNALMTGDTKGRSLRALQTSVNLNYIKREGVYAPWKNH